MNERNKVGHRGKRTTLEEILVHVNNSVVNMEQFLGELKSGQNTHGLANEELKSKIEQFEQGINVRTAELEAIQDEVERGGFSLEIPYIDFLDTINSQDYLEKTNRNK